MLISPVFDIVAGIMHCTFLALAAAGLLALVQNTAAQAQFKYPAAPISNQVDDYNGVKVADPYRSLENPTLPSRGCGSTRKTRSRSIF